MAHYGSTSSLLRSMLKNTAGEITVHPEPSCMSSSNLPGANHTAYQMHDIDVYGPTSSSTATGSRSRPAAAPLMSMLKNTKSSCATHLDGDSRERLMTYSSPLPAFTFGSSALLMSMLKNTKATSTTTTAASSSARPAVNSTTTLLTMTSPLAMSMLKDTTSIMARTAVGSPLSMLKNLATARFTIYNDKQTEPGAVKQLVSASTVDETPPTKRQKLNTNNTGDKKAATAPAAAVYSKLKLHQDVQANAFLAWCQSLGNKNVFDEAIVRVTFEKLEDGSDRGPCTSYGMLTGNDVLTVVGTKWLNENAINTFLHTLVLVRARGPTTSASSRRITILDTRFFHCLNEGNGPLSKKAARMTNYVNHHAAAFQQVTSVDMFSGDILTVINVDSNHWILCVIPHHSSYCSSQPRTIYLLDPRGGERKSVMTLLSAWVCDMFPGGKTTINPIYSCPNLPVQQDGYNCGVYVCMFAYFWAQKGSFPTAQTEFAELRECPTFRHLMVDTLRKAKSTLTKGMPAVRSTMYLSMPTSHIADPFNWAYTATKRPAKEENNRARQVILIEDTPTPTNTLTY
jgi:hypothetical protein